MIALKRKAASWGANESEESISSLSGRWEALANWFSAGVMRSGILYPSVEHAFQAAKASDVSPIRSPQLTRTRTLIHTLTLTLTRIFTLTLALALTQPLTRTLDFDLPRRVIRGRRRRFGRPQALRRRTGWASSCACPVTGRGGGWS